MDTQKVVIGYWWIRGKAQYLRYIIEYLGIPYEDKRYTTIEQWFQGDLTKEPFKSHTLVNLPYLIDGDEYIYESDAIAVYLAHRANRPELLGATIKDQILLTQYLGVISDLLLRFILLIRMPKEQFEEKRNSEYEQNMHWLLERLDKLLENRKYALGDYISIVDFRLLEVSETFIAFKGEAFKEFKNLSIHHETMINVPQIKQYMASERFSAQPFYPVGASFSWG